MLVKSARLLVALTVLSMLLPACCPAPKNRNIVSRIIDADTIVIENQTEGARQIDLAWIDAPEREQPFGREAARFVSNKILNKEVSFNQSNELIVDGASLNQLMLSEGMAWLTPQHSGYELQFSYSEAQNLAMNSGKGLWSLPHELRVPPWVWREQGQHNNRQPAKKLMKKPNGPQG